MSDMGSAPPERQTRTIFGTHGAREVVAFDFDGTLTTHDSFTTFLKWRAGPLRWTMGMVKLAPAALAYLGHRDRGRIKADAVRAFLGGVDRATVAADADRYAEAVCSDFIRPDALACWNDWGAKGVHRVIVTASPEITVAPFARRLGAENLLGTHMAFDDQDRVTGAFTGSNCRGEEKVRRLKAAYGDQVRIIAAYGDTSGDTEMLAASEQPGFRVFTARP